MANQLFGQNGTEDHNYMRVSSAGGIYVHAIDSVALSAVYQLSGEVIALSAEVQAISGGGEASNLTVFEMKNAVKEAQNAYFTSGKYDVDDQPTNYDTWTDETMTTKLFTQTLTWVSGNLTESVLVDETDSKTLSSVFYYTAGGNLDRYKEVIV